MSEKQRRGPMTLSDVKLQKGNLKNENKDHKPLVAYALGLTFQTTPLLRKRYTRDINISIVKGARPEHIADGLEALAAEIRKTIPDIGEPVVQLVTPPEVSHETKPT